MFFKFLSKAKQPLAQSQYIYVSKQAVDKLNKLERPLRLRVDGISQDILLDSDMDVCAGPI